MVGRNGLGQGMINWLHWNGTEVMISMALGGARCTCVGAMNQSITTRPEYWGLKQVHVDPCPLCCWRENVNTSTRHPASDSIIVYSCVHSASHCVLNELFDCDLPKEAHLCVSG